MKTDNEKYNEQVKPNTAFLRALKSKLPEFFNKKNEFDIEKFKNALKSKNINELRDGYQLNFIGKDYARRQAGEIPKSVIVPDEKQNNGEGKNSKNLFFTGDNIEVLRHLQSAYSNKVDVIYIDPPYNTGSDDFAYPDTFEYSDQQLKDMFGIDDDELDRLKSIQGKSNHSAWLAFLYPRLQLAKNLLKESGLLAISIDDNEAANLKILLDEIMGESNFIMQIAWRRTDNQPNVGNIAKVKEYILIYSKNDSDCEIGHVPLSTKAKKEYRYCDNIGNFRRGILLDKTRGRFKYPLKTKNGRIVNGPWMVSKEDFRELQKKGLIYWTSSGKELPYKKLYLKDRKGAIPNDFWGIEAGTNQRASNEFQHLMGKRYFSFPKPVSLIRRVLLLSPNKNALIMDFFAGSATTAEAVMQQNAEDEGYRRYIMIQLPEKTYHFQKNGKKVPTKGGRIAFEDGYMSIDQIARKRIRFAAKKIEDDNPLTLSKDFDGSFKHYRVVKPAEKTLNEIDEFNPNGTQLFTNMVDSFSSKEIGIPGDATGEQTILTTWLTKDGYTFDAEVKPVQFGNYTAHNVEGNRLYIINKGWKAEQTKDLLNKLGNHELNIQSVVVFGYSFNIAELRELEIGLKQLDNNITLIKRY